MTFYQRYRPKDFDEVIGNKHVIKSLESLFNEDDLISHVFLFHGQSGCGKTTFARIIADRLKCSEYDFIEINTGNNRGIDTAREVLKTVHYLPTQGKNKVILFDECHQTTKDFQSALLKVLEDTPSHVYFILCTTHPEKLLPTIRNRCVTYEVELLSDKELKILLDRVAKKEDKILLKKVRKRIIEKVEGCPRQALILLEEIIFMKGKDQIKAIRIFKSNEEKIIDLCRAIIKKEKWEKICKILRGIEEDPETVRRTVLGYINSIMLTKNSPRCMLIYLAFKEPLYNTGKAGLTFSCYRAVDY